MSKNTGDFDFTGQDPYEESDKEPIGDSPELRHVGFTKRNTSNSFNGSGGSRKTISPNKVKGSNP